MDCMRTQFVEGVVLNGRYETISPLNHGSFGMVFMAKDLVTGETVALKCLTKKGAANACPMNLAFDDRSEELEIHRRIGGHRNIVNLYDTFETDSHIYLVQEFCANGDLYEAIRSNRGPLETEHVRDAMHQLVDAVEFLHRNGVYHRDLKPENILLSQSGALKIGDFGLATMDKVSHESAVGSDRYMAPEQLEPGSYGYSPAKADIWAIGICLLNMLFARNPFATPTQSDPLFADFAGDRQTLFDVFPSMSQDTFEVLMPSLALDPSKRSLSAIRAALDRVLSFTTDDAFMDEFCAENNEAVCSTANREPLRTPSVATAQLDQNGAFPWARALALSPPQPIRQLSVVHDTESYQHSIDAREENTTRLCKQDAASIASFVDSGLGVSIGSQATDLESQGSYWNRSGAVAGSLPASAARPVPSMSNVFGKRDHVSKSWSDIWDEEEELLRQNDKPDSGRQFTGFKQRLINEERSQQSSGNTTPRAVLSEIKNPSQVNNSRDRKVETSDAPAVNAPSSQISEHTGFIFEDHPVQNASKYSPPSKRSLLEKWEALGDRRRARAKSFEKQSLAVLPHTPVKTNMNDKPVSAAWQDGVSYKRTRAGSWRRHNDISTTNTPTSTYFITTPRTAGLQSHGNTGASYFPHPQPDFKAGAEQSRKDWSLSRDWRRPGGNTSRVSKQQLPSSLRKQKSAFTLSAAHDDAGDFEWVGGCWNDLHL